MNRSLPTIKQQNWGNDLNNYIKELEEKVNNIDLIQMIETANVNYSGSGVIEINNDTGVFLNLTSSTKKEHGDIVEGFGNLCFSGVVYFSNTLSNTSVVLNCTNNGNDNENHRLALNSTGVIYSSNNLYRLYVKLNTNGTSASFYVKEGDFTSNELLSRITIPIGYIFMDRLYYTIGNVSLTKAEQFKSYMYPTGNIKYLNFNNTTIDLGTQSKENKITVTGLGYNIVSDDNTACTFSINNTKPIYIFNDEDDTYSYNTVDSLSALNNTIFRIMISNTGTLVIQYRGLETDTVVDDTFVKYYSFNKQPYKALGCVEVARVSNSDGPVKNVIFWAAANGISPYLSTNLIPRQSNIINMGSATPDAVFASNANGDNSFVIIGENGSPNSTDTMKLQLNSGNYLLTNGSSFGNDIGIELTSALGISLLQDDDNKIEILNSELNIRHNNRINIDSKMVQIISLETESVVNIDVENTNISSKEVSINGDTTINGELQINLPKHNLQSLSLPQHGQQQQLQDLVNEITSSSNSIIGSCYVKNNGFKKVNLKCEKNIDGSDITQVSVDYKIIIEKNNEELATIVHLKKVQNTLNVTNEVYDTEINLYCLNITSSDFDKYFSSAQNELVNILDLIGE